MFCENLMPGTSISLYHFDNLQFEVISYSGQIMLFMFSPYSVRMRENTDENNSKYGHFSRSDSFQDTLNLICNRGTIDIPSSLPQYFKHKTNLLQETSNY